MEKNEEKTELTASPSGLTEFIKICRPDIRKRPYHLMLSLDMESENNKQFTEHVDFVPMLCVRVSLSAVELISSFTKHANQPAQFTQDKRKVKGLLPRPLPLNFFLIICCDDEQETDFILTLTPDMSEYYFAKKLGKSTFIPFFQIRIKLNESGVNKMYGKRNKYIIGY